MERFSSFLINEERSFLGNQVGDVLSSLQSIQGDIENIGSRQLSKYSEEVVNQIRKLLHKTWNPKYHNQLRELQKIGVAIQKTIDERGDLKQVLPAAVSALSSLSGRLGVKVNNLKAPEAGTDLSAADFQSTGEQPDFKKRSPNPQQAGQMPQAEMMPSNAQTDMMATNPSMGV